MDRSTRANRGVRKGRAWQMRLHQIFLLGLMSTISTIYVRREEHKLPPPFRDTSHERAQYDRDTFLSTLASSPSTVSYCTRAFTMSKAWAQPDYGEVETAKATQ